MQEELAKKMEELQRMMAAGGMGPAAAPGGMPLGFAPPAAAPGFGPSPMAAPGGLPAPVGWSVALEIPMSGPQGPGKVNVDLAYAPETWMQAPQIVSALLQAGYPVKVWMPKKQGWGGNGGGGGGRGWGG